MPRTYGALRERPQDAETDRLERPASVAHRASTSEPILSDWRHLTHADPHPDQGPTEACVVFGVNGSLDLADRAEGLSSRPASIPWGYAISWWIEKPNTPVDPGGRMLRSLLVGYQTHGLASAIVWPFDPKTILEPPPFNVDLAADTHRMKLGGWRRAVGDVVHVCEEALAQGEFPVFAMDIYENYDAYTERFEDGFLALNGVAVYNGPKGKFLGRHVQVLQGRGPGYFIIRNSWGSGWGDHGFGYISDAAFRDYRYVSEQTLIDKDAA